MFSLRTHGLISGVLFAAIIVGAIVGNILHDQGWLPDSSAAQLAAQIIFFGLFLAFGYSLIPLMVKLVLGGHVAIGNAGHPTVQTLQKHERTIIFALWGLITLGLAIAIPAAIHDGFFGADPAAEIAATPSRGTVVARPGIAIDEMRRLSSLPIKGSADTVFADGNLFDFRVAGTAIEFKRCRYYYMTTERGDRNHIANISVGVSPSTMSVDALAKANAALQARLAADGWLVGHQVYAKPEDQRLYGSELEATRNRSVWLKDGTVLRILNRRMDDAKSGEADGAGQWIQFVELSTRDGFSMRDRYEFDKPK